MFLFVGRRRTHTRTEQQKFYENRRAKGGSEGLLKPTRETTTKKRGVYFYLYGTMAFTGATIIAVHTVILLKSVRDRGRSAGFRPPQVESRKQFANTGLNQIPAIRSSSSRAASSNNQLQKTKKQKSDRNKQKRTTDARSSTARPEHATSSPPCRRLLREFRHREDEFLAAVLGHQKNKQK